MPLYPVASKPGVKVTMLVIEPSDSSDIKLKMDMAVLLENTLPEKYTPWVCSFTVFFFLFNLFTIENSDLDFIDFKNKLLTQSKKYLNNNFFIIKFNVDDIIQSDIKQHNIRNL